MSDSISVDNGKYTFIVSGDGTIRIDRYGEPWIANFDGAGDRAVMALVYEAIDLRNEVAKLKGGPG